MDRGALQATVHGVTEESDTTKQLKNNNGSYQEAGGKEFLSSFPFSK